MNETTRIKQTEVVSDEPFIPGDGAESNISQAILPTNGASLNQWRYSFQHKGRSYTLFKRVDSKTAPYYVHIQRLKQRYKHSLETNVRAVAVDRAKIFIDSIIGEKWEVVTQLKVRRTVSTLAQVEAVYRRIAGIADRSIKNNILSMHKILERVKGEIPDPEKVSLHDLTPALLVSFQEATVKLYCADLPLNPDIQREARERAFRSSRSTISQARSLFSRRAEHDLIARYDQEGLTIPPTINEFMTCKLRGKPVKEDYLNPPDKVVQAAFSEIERVKDHDRNVYLAFWLAVGAGLRRKEIQRCDWSNVVERDGMTWISGGLGKDGRRIEVPMQSKAVAALQPFRKKSGKVLEGEDGLEWAKRLNWWMRLQGWRTEKKLHELRAYVGSLIYQRSPLAAMKFMRHKTIKVTEQYYCRYGGDVKPVDVL